MERIGKIQSIKNFVFDNEGKAPFRSATGLYGYIDKDGVEVLAPKYYSAGSFFEDIASVGLSIDELNDVVEIGFIDEVGAVGIRQGDIYPSSDFVDCLMPILINDAAISFSHYNNRNIAIDSTGFNKPSLPTSPMLCNFNEDDLGLYRYEPITGLPPQNVIVNRKGEWLYFWVNNKKIDPQLSNRDKLRLLLFDRYNPHRIGYVLNTLSNGIYLMEDATHGNYLLSFNSASGRFTIVHQLDEEMIISQFYNEKALYFEKNKGLYLVDKALNSISPLIDFNGANEELKMTYVPGSKYVTVYCDSNDRIQSDLNVFDLENGNWMLQNNIRRSLDLMTYSEVNDGLLFYKDYAEQEGGDNVERLHILNLLEQNDPVVCLRATDPSNERVCVQFEEENYHYIDYSGNSIFSFEK